MKTYPTRRDMIADLGADLVGVEVGVQRGDFSAEMLELPNVSQLWLVDAWRRIGGRYAQDPADIDDGGHEANFLHVSRRFEAEREAERVILLRKLSLEAAPLFRGTPFDFVYLDADHTYEGLSADLRAWAPKVKRGGHLCGHDFTDRPEAKRMGFGVMQAVEDFCRVTEWRLVAVTTEEWPSFKLTRQ